MTGNEYSLTAEILETADITVVDRNLALEILRKNPDLCFEVVEILAQEVAYMRQSTAAALAKADAPRASNVN